MSTTAKRRRTPIQGCLLVLVVGALACRAPFDPVVLRYQGVDVRRSAFIEELEPLRSNGTDTTDPAMRLSAFRRFVQERVVSIAAGQNGFNGAVGSPNGPEMWLASRLTPGTISEAEARDYYEAHPEVASVPEAVTIREILLATLQNARDVVRILNSDRNAFELLARTRSLSPQVEGGGLLGSFRRGELPSEIEQVAFSMAPGQISGIVTTSFGYHVLRLESKTIATTRTLAESRPEIESRLAESKARLRMKQLIDALLSQAQVNYEVVMAP